ncbi:hypothetical protein RHMOL_Rhmol10G0026800 [Rhododendron molle]|uniref:Uncharacterized protein n=1 Tax=Rhododendron molle TaxID=49168 RepID=A0ACC0LZQ7_RHOML|nr:hypothetical protein RHMOL_Rhmol10G0026800 [Rhododendron molle]
MTPNWKLKKPPHLNWVLLPFLNLLTLSLSDPRIYEAALLCGPTATTNTTAPPRPKNFSYIPAFVKEMELLSQQVNTSNWGQTAVNSTGVIPIYALAQCHDDLPHTDCLLCYAVARTRLPHCLPALSGRVYLDGCFLRYDKYDFFGESVDPVRDSVNCTDSGGGSGGGVARGAEFNSSVGDLIDNVTQTAVANGGFAVGQVKGVFGLAVCWKNVSSDGCRDCLEKAANDVRECLPSGEGESAIGIIVSIALAATAFFMFSLFAIYACYVRLPRLKQERNNLGQVSASFNKSSLNFKYEALEKATDYFNPSRKIGQGGAGSVFKGTLPNRETIAVKRLFYNTRQWVDEFFNEVNLISGIQHKNLVKLLGCSIEGPESLLVYEYVPNKNLDQFLFGKCLLFLGYMAPEYLVRGQLTEKADVYSYGVLVLEIICGRKSHAFVEDSCSLLQSVWQLYKTNRLPESIDPRLNGDFPEKEASCVLQIGLLCTQASVALRPSMEEVVDMLINRDNEIPVPNQPPFLTASAVNPASSDRSCSINSLILNALTKMGASGTSTESSTMPSSDEPSRSV